MNYLSVENLSKHYGERVLFENLYFGLNEGDKVALIANNGAGKSTLLKILVGKDVPDGGKVTTRNGIRIGFLDQNPTFNVHQTVNEFIKTANSIVLEVIKEYERALHAQSEDYNEKTHEAFEKASHLMNDMQAWDYDRRMETVLSKFNITDKEQKIETLSGGERKRLALALLLLDNPQLIILDEPTNHLDVEMIEWLEDYLTRTNVTLLMVTHDRYFLDRVCNEILELTDGKLYTHTGNYSYFLEKREAREQVYDVEAAKAKQLLKHELEWMRKMPKARTTKSKSRIDAFYDIKEKAGSRKIRQQLKLQVKMLRMGGKILEMKKVYKSYGDTKILSGFDYTFKKGERIGIVGKNGVGKTTFLNIITGKDTPDSGKVNTGDTIVYGYYTQSGIKLKDDKRVIEVVRDIADFILMGDGSKLS
ncbi:MAG: ABC-F family ATP-binding cassette domain-containing protein, partial [Bacteroidia bacterium]|nr:ABC-F family ATP-binding cassette domain-containing protein [Bacteroidia bacterium]